MVMKILIVDDSPVDARLIQEMIKKDGLACDFVLADNGASALEAAKDDIDIVIMDVLMPGINGFDVAKQIKEMKPEIKIVIITNAEEEINPERVKACGIDLYTSKKIMDYTIPRAVRMLKEKLEGK